MPADLTKPFSESCCDGGECSTNDMSAQSCGCDKGANWLCQIHRIRAEEDAKWNKYIESIKEYDESTKDTF